LLVVFNAMMQERKSPGQRPGEWSLVDLVVSRHLGGGVGSPAGAAPGLRDPDWHELAARDRGLRRDEISALLRQGNPASDHSPACPWAWRLFLNVMTGILFFSGTRINISVTTLAA
jgi:hypothetical protein